jgi:hypothetical protein
MSAYKKAKETCQAKLERMVQETADDITHCSGGRERSAADWMEGTYDIRYLVNREKQYLGAEILVAGGGPTIWVDTFTKEVRGYWGTDRVQRYFIDNLGLDDYCEEMYGY